MPRSGVLPVASIAVFSAASTASEPVVARKIRFERLGQKLREPFEQPHADLGWVNVAHAVHEPLRLIRNGRHDARVAMTGIGNAERGRAVDIFIAVDVGHGRAASRLPKDRKIVGEKRDVALLVRAKQRRQLRAARAGDAHVSSTIQRTNSAIRGRPPWNAPSAAPAALQTTLRAPRRFEPPSKAHPGAPPATASASIAMPWRSKYSAAARASFDRVDADRERKERRRCLERRSRERRDSRHVESE